VVSAALGAGPAAATAPRRLRAVVLVGGPAAPYSRGLRAARALAGEGYAVELAATAADGLPDREQEALFEVRRYRPSGAWARLATLGRREPGRVEPARVGSGRVEAAGPSRGSAGPPTGRRGFARRVGRRLVNLLGALRRWIFWPYTARGWWATLARELEPADLYHACGSLTIAAALAARRRHPRGPSGGPAKVIYDAVDDVMEGNNVLDMPGLLLAIHARRERAWARAADAVLTVSEPLADRLEARWQRRPIAVPNYPAIEPERGSDRDSSVQPGTARATDASAPEAERRAPGGGPLRLELGLAIDIPIVLFQGRIGPLRGLDEAAEAVLGVPGAVLVLMGFGQGYERAQARDRDPRFAGRHITIPARHPDELLAWTADADVALIPVPPTSINQRLASPNKFWEAIGAGTPVVVPASITFMAGVIEKEDVGVVAASDSVVDLAAAIREVLRRSTADPAWRDRIRQVGIERYSWPVAAAAYVDVVRSLGSGPSR
jgi:glycosyltransferase involved in cell wall biosynthesis